MSPRVDHPKPLFETHDGQSFTERFRVEIDVLQQDAPILQIGVPEPPVAAKYGATRASSSMISVPYGKPSCTFPDNPRSNPGNPSTSGIGFCIRLPSTARADAPQRPTPHQSVEKGRLPPIHLGSVENNILPS